jgi:predicted nucleotidyltransferase
MPSRSTHPSIRSLRTTVLAITAARGVQNVRVFGSFARGEQRRGSDLDLLVRMPKRSSLLDLAGLKVALEEALRMKVDVLTDDGISRYLRKRILEEAKPL